MSYFFLLSTFCSRGIVARMGKKASGETVTYIYPFIRVCKKLEGIFSIPNNKSRNGAECNGGEQTLPTVIALRSSPASVFIPNLECPKALLGAGRVELPTSALSGSIVKNGLSSMIAIKQGYVSLF